MQKVVLQECIARRITVQRKGRIVLLDLMSVIKFDVFLAYAPVERYPCVGKSGLRVVGLLSRLYEDGVEAPQD